MLPALNGNTVPAAVSHLPVAIDYPAALALVSANDIRL